MKSILDESAGLLKRQRNLSYLNEDFGILSDMVTILKLNFY